MNPPPDNDAQGGPPNKNSRILESLAEALFRAGTLEGPEAYAAAGLRPGRGAAPTAEPATVAAS